MSEHHEWIDSAIESLRDINIRKHNPTIDISEDLLLELSNFQKSLTDGQEMKIEMRSLPPGAKVSRVSRLGANLLVFEGTVDELPFKLIQHHSQTSICIMVTSSQSEQPRRIGFEV